MRRPLTNTNPRLRTVLHSDFLNYSVVAEAFDSIDACLFCLGVSVTQVSKDEYRKITHDYTLAAAHLLQIRSPHAAFHYISGQGTSAASRMFWSRVKAQTEIELIDVIGADCWRPAFIDARPSASLPKISPPYPVLRLLKPSETSTSRARISAMPCLKPPERTSLANFREPGNPRAGARFKGR
jgi:hypothetical protein